MLAAGVKNLISLKAIEKSNARGEIDFHKYRKLAFFISWVVVAVGIASIYLNKEKILGLDFRGGEESIVSFGEMIDAGDLDETFSAPEIGEVQHAYRSEVGSGEEASRLVLQTEVGKGRAIALLQSKFPSANLVEQGLKLELL